jgi:hypothetical protein
MHSFYVLEKTETNGEQLFHSFGIFFIHYKDNHMVLCLNHNIMMGNNNLAIAYQSRKGGARG